MPCRLNLLLVCLIFCGCTKSLPSLDNFDGVAWKDDKGACAGKRNEMVESILSQKTKLLSLSELEIVKILGHPDQHELYKRNQKFYFYFTQPSKDCPTPTVNPHKLAIRFNAMGLAKEIVME